MATPTTSTLSRDVDLDLSEDFKLVTPRLMHAKARKENFAAKLRRKFTIRHQNVSKRVYSKKPELTVTKKIKSEARIENQKRDSNIFDDAPDSNLGSAEEESVFHGKFWIEHVPAYSSNDVFKIRDDLIKKILSADPENNVKMVDRKQTIALPFITKHSTEGNANAHDLEMNDAEPYVSYSTNNKALVLKPNNTVCLEFKHMIDGPEDLSDLIWQSCIYYSNIYKTYFQSSFDRLLSYEDDNQGSIYQFKNNTIANHNFAVNASAFEVSSESFEDTSSNINDTDSCEYDGESRQGNHCKVPFGNKYNDLPTKDTVLSAIVSRNPNKFIKREEVEIIDSPLNNDLQINIENSNMQQKYSHDTVSTIKSLPESYQKVNKKLEIPTSVQRLLTPDEGNILTNTSTQGTDSTSSCPNWELPIHKDLEKIFKELERIRSVLGYTDKKGLSHCNTRHHSKKPNESKKHPYHSKDHVNNSTEQHNQNREQKKNIPLDEHEKSMRNSKTQTSVQVHYSTHHKHNHKHKNHNNKSKNQNDNPEIFETGEMPQNDQNNYICVEQAMMKDLTDIKQIFVNDNLVQSKNARHSRKQKPRQGSSQTQILHAHHSGNKSGKKQNLEEIYNDLKHMKATLSNKKTSLEEKNQELLVKNRHLQHKNKKLTKKLQEKKLNFESFKMKKPLQKCDTANIILRADCKQLSRIIKKMQKEKIDSDVHSQSSSQSSDSSFVASDHEPSTSNFAQKKLRNNLKGLSMLYSGSKSKNKRKSKMYSKPGYDGVEKEPSNETTQGSPNNKKDLGILHNRITCTCQETGKEFNYVFKNTNFGKPCDFHEVCILPDYNKYIFNEQSARKSAEKTGVNKTVLNEEAKVLEDQKGVIVCNYSKKTEVPKPVICLKDYENMILQDTIKIKLECNNEDFKEHCTNSGITDEPTCSTEYLCRGQSTHCPAASQTICGDVTDLARLDKSTIVKCVKKNRSKYNDGKSSTDHYKINIKQYSNSDIETYVSEDDVDSESKIELTVPLSAIFKTKNDKKRSKKKKDLVINGKG